MTDQLKQLLTDMADEVEPASLHERAVRQSHRTSTRHAVMAAVAALLVVGGGLGFNGFAASEPAEDTAANPPTETTARPPSDSDTRLDGVFYDGYFIQGGGESILSWTADDPVPAEVASGDGSERFYHTGAVSPDGRYVAYLTVEDPDVSDPPDGQTDFPATGQVMVRDLHDDSDIALTDYDETENGCSLPTWSPDGRLFVDHGQETDPRYGFYDPATGDFTPTVDLQGCDVKIAQDDDGDALFIALEHLGGDTFDLTVTTGDGQTTTSPARETLRDPLGNINYLTDVSVDGRYACLRVGEGNSGYFPDRMPYCEYIVDIETGGLIMATGDQVSDQEAPKSPGGVGNPASLSIPGHVLVYDGGNGEYKLADLTGQIVDAVPASYADGFGEPQLIDYVPAG